MHMSTRLHLNIHSKREYKIVTYNKKVLLQKMSYYQGVIIAECAE